MSRFGIGALVGLVWLAILAYPAAAQEGPACQSPSGARTTARATDGPVTCAGLLPADARRVAVVFLAGYGSDLVSADFVSSPLQAALGARQPDVAFVQYSYTGTTFSGCAATPSPYTPWDTAQDIGVSKRILHETLAALKSACDVDHIAIVGHSLGGLIALEALAEQPEPTVSDLVTVDSPLGGVPLAVMRTCIESGFCADGVIANYLVGLYGAWGTTATDNTSRATLLAAAATRLSAWGNQSDCFYDVALCSTFARAFLARYDARETQWIGIPRTVRKDYPFAAYLWNIPASHVAVMRNAAPEIAADLLP